MSAHDHDHDHDHDHGCGGSHKVEVDLCDLILCGAKIGKMACKCGKKHKECCAGIQASGGQTQRITEPDVPEKAVMDQIDLVDQVKVVSPTTFEIECDGVYFIMAAPQVGSVPNLSTPANFRCWININGAPAPNSNVLMNLQPGGVTKDVIVSQGAFLLKKGDQVEVMVAASAPGVLLEAIQPTPQEPLVPSIIFTMVWECPPPKRIAR